MTELLPDRIFVMRGRSLYVRTVLTARDVRDVPYVVFEPVGGGVRSLMPLHEFSLRFMPLPVVEVSL